MTLEQIVKQSQGEQYVYPDVFTDKCGLDIILSNDKLHAVRSWGYTKGNPKRRATLEITTFRGISFNAVHHYGKIKIQGLNFIRVVLYIGASAGGSIESVSLFITQRSAMRPSLR